MTQHNEDSHGLVKTEAAIAFLAGKGPEKNPYAGGHISANSGIALIWAYHYGNFAMGVKLGAISAKDCEEIMQSPLALELSPRNVRRAYDQKYKAKQKQKKELV